MENFFEIPAFTQRIFYKDFEFVVDCYLAFMGSQACDLRKILYKKRDIFEITNQDLQEINNKFNYKFNKEELIQYLHVYCNNKIFMN